MSIETYEKQVALGEIYQKLSVAEKQISDIVPLLDGTEVFDKSRSCWH
jgi:hypothetical protein